MNDTPASRQDFTPSNSDKILFPDIRLSKGELIAYYRDVAPVMLPHLKHRPLTLERFPDGVDANGFIQQARSAHFPNWLEGLTVDHGGESGRIEHILCNHETDLAFLADQGTISLHRWLSEKERLDCPNLLIFDLDPPGEDFTPVKQAAWQVKAGMTSLGLTPFVMTTGSRGLHVVAPIRPENDFDQVRDLAQRLARHLAERHRHTLTTEQRKNKRQGRLYLDIMRNAFGQTAVAPYSVRAKPGAPVATPLEWHELEQKDLGPQDYTVNNLRRRLGQKKDPWKGMQRHAVKLDTALKGLERLSG
ncbi:non-homologous end-joining DNA ligase [Marinobacteraceae bacterium S3BR75-40.1]